MSFVALNALWRPNSTGPAPQDREDLELVRQYAELPATDQFIIPITRQMNLTAERSPATVAKIQAWINEIESLEADQADKIADGTAFLGDVEEYEGLRPGYNPARSDLVKKADVLEWDVESIARVKIKTGRGGGSQSGSIYGRIAELKDRILVALVLKDLNVGDGSFALERS